MNNKIVAGLVRGSAPQKLKFTSETSGYGNLKSAITGGLPLLRFRVWRCFVFLSVLDRTGWLHSGGNSHPWQNPSLQKEPHGNY